MLFSGTLVKGLLALLAKSGWITYLGLCYAAIGPECRNEASAVLTQRLYLRGWWAVCGHWQIRRGMGYGHGMEWKGKERDGSIPRGLDDGRDLLVLFTTHQAFEPVKRFVRSCTTGYGIDVMLH